MQGGNAADVRFQVAQFVPGDLAHFDPVRLAALDERLHQGNLFALRCHDDFAADIVGDPIRPAEIDHGAVSFAAEPRLETPRPIVHSRVDHSAVMSRLMLSPRLLLLQEKEARCGKCLAQCEPGGQADDATAHDSIVERRHQEYTFTSGIGTTNFPPHSRMYACCSMISSLKFHGRMKR